MIERKPKSPKEYGPSPVEKHHDSESVADFVHGVTDDLTRLRKEELTSRAREGREKKFAVLIKELNEIEADESMIKSEREKALKHIQTQESHAKVDALTDLPNRRAFLEKAHSDVELINRLEDHGAHESVHALFIDFDGFKVINDKFGHKAGDLYLKMGAEFMRREVHRSTDMIARFGGDEFAAILFGGDDTFAQGIAKKLIQAVQQASHAAKEQLRTEGMKIADGEGNISASIGLATQLLKESAGDLLNRADAAMYDAKRAGKDQVVVAAMSKE